MSRHRRWLVSAAVVAALMYAARFVDWSAAGATLARASIPLVLAAVLVNGTSLLLRGVRWWIFLRHAGATSLILAMRGAIVGAGLNNLVIANGGDVARVLLVARESGVSTPSTAATLALDRVFDPLCFVLLLFAATFAVPLPSAFGAARLVAAIGIGGVVAALGALAHGSRGRAARTTHGCRASVTAFLYQLRRLSTAPRFCAALACSAGVWSLQLCEYAIVARSLDLALPFAGSVAAMVLINAGLVLRATPGGLGYFQFAYAIAVAPFAIPAHAAVATAMLIQIVEIVPVTIAAVALAPTMLTSTRAHRTVRRCWS